MYKFYVVEVQKSGDASFAHLIHEASDNNYDVARMKGESKYHQVLAAAAISNLPAHSAIMFSSEGIPMMYQCYHHAQAEEQTEE